VTTFRQLLEFFEQSAKTQAAKGKRFEDFCEAFLQTDPYWAERLDAVWSWQEWPDRPQGLPDTGVDLVARERGTGRLIAVQCKFYSPSAVLGWEHVSTFIAMLSQDVFSAGMLISTAGAESGNLHKNLAATSKDVTWFRVENFEESLVDWNQFRPEAPTQLSLADRKTLRPHQELAIADVRAGFDAGATRGQMIMACGTGKTFTSLRLAEQMVGVGGTVLFLVPSINLLSQTVIEWANDAELPLATFAVCSDRHAGTRTKDDEDMSANDLQVPASTNVESLIAEWRARATPTRMSVVFSTYQSIEVVSEAQKAGLGRFDLVVCDEAHRTTGGTGPKAGPSAFVMVHDDEVIEAGRRIYMTATPRIYGDQTKAKAKQHEVVLSSMDDEATFGPVFHELPFGKAVADKLLTDYKVLVLAVNEDAVSDAFQRQFTAQGGGELPLNDVARMVGCWHGLSKRGPQFKDSGDEQPMRRAVAFSSTIKQSKRFTDALPNVIAAALEERKDRNAVRVEAKHVDGTTNVKVRQESIAWLEESPGQRVCRVLSNAKCLTEGVDVPALDAVVFLNPRKSIVDVVQAVGRVMRRLEGKDFGYVILPIGIPGSMSPEEALRDNDRYAVVWEVLQALRSHDERLRAEINKIDINKTSSKVSVIGIGLAGGDSADNPGVTTTADGEHGQMSLDLPDLAEWRDALYARIVDKVGDRQYMEHWAKDIADIANAQETRIRSLLAHPEQNPAAIERFEHFHQALKDNLNDGVSADDAISMLSQHLITRPVFEALFGGDQFTKQNPVSQVMQSMIDTLDESNIDAETATLEGFYEHIRMLVGGIDSAEGRQKVIAELYEKFFKKVVPKTASSLGIVYTPVEIVDFINRAVNDLLHEHFDGASLSDEGVHVLDPFTGTGTFIARMIQSGLIAPEALPRKYASELHANELMLLAYYIAAINIETAYRGAIAQATGTESDVYEPFTGIVLTDTFQMTEEDDSMDTIFFPRNNERADRQKALDIRVIVGNPPYSVGQSSQNDDNANLSYPTLDSSIERTYSRRSTASSKKSLYDSYIRAIRWATNRLAGCKDGGIVGFVSNGGWLDANSADGIRHSLSDEFDHIYVFNLRGNQRTSGDQSRREGGKVFGSGSRNTVAITLLVQQPGMTVNGPARIHYRDIGDYLAASEKLEIVGSATVAKIQWRSVAPNDQADWISQRSELFDALVPLSGEPSGLFEILSLGVATGRDAWTVSSCRAAVSASIDRLTEHFNAETNRYRDEVRAERLSADAESAARFVDRDPTRVSWTANDFRRVASGKMITPDQISLVETAYRPFFRQHLAYGSAVNQRTYQLPKLFPAGLANVGIGIVHPGSKSPFGVVAIGDVPSLHLINSDATSVLALHRFNSDAEDNLLSNNEDATGLASNLRPSAVQLFRDSLGDDITDNDAFHYVYGVLHSPDFRSEFEVNLKKEAPRVPLVTDRAAFDAFVAAGAELMELHIGYDDPDVVELFPLVEAWTDGIGPEHPGFDPSRLLVGASKMKYPKASDTDPESETYGKKIPDKTRLVYNDYLTLSGIPERAHDYVLGTRSGIDWIIDRWYVKTDKASGIVNDVNQWGLEQDKPFYIIDLIKQVVTLSLRTVEIVESLPRLRFDEHGTHVVG
jgi:predicted helicase